MADMIDKHGNPLSLTETERQWIYATFFYSGIAIPVVAEISTFVHGGAGFEETISGIIFRYFLVASFSCGSLFAALFLRRAQGTSIWGLLIFCWIISTLIGIFYA